MPATRALWEQAMTQQPSLFRLLISDTEKDSCDVITPTQ
jgi:hypothetical protein